MTKQVTYTYLGTNGTLTTPIHLEGIYSVKKIVLTADEGKKLTKDNINLVDRVTVRSDEEVELWKEVSAPSGQE
jgi:hypothetical protein